MNVDSPNFGGAPLGDPDNFRNVTLNSADDGDRYRDWDAAYALDALSPTDRDEFTAHLQDCAPCRERVSDAAATVRLLGALPESAFADAEPLPDGLLPATLRRAARERARRRWWAAGAAGAAAACILALALAVWPSTTTGAGTGPARALSAVRPSPVHASATLVSRAWGTEIHLRCRYGAVGYARTPYRLVVVDRSHLRHDLGSWTLSTGEDIDFTAGTDLARQRIAAVQITLDNGSPILQLTL